MTSTDCLYGFIGNYYEGRSFPSTLAQILDVAEGVREEDGRYMFNDDGTLYSLRFSGEEDIRVERYHPSKKWVEVRSPEKNIVKPKLQYDTWEGRWKLVFTVVPLDWGLPEAAAVTNATTPSPRPT